MLVDTHCHLGDSPLPEAIFFIHNAVDFKNAEEILKSTQSRCVFGAVGVHPWKAQKKLNVEKLKEYCAHPKTVAIGEIGLDFSFSYQKNAPLQMEVLEKQFALARDLHLPVIVHSVKAGNVLLTLFKKYNIKGSLHGFSSSFEEAQCFTQMGVKIGINPSIFKPHFKKARALAKNLPAESLLLESDFPYASPHLNALPELLSFLAHLRGENEDFLEKTLEENTRSVFEKMVF